MLDESGSELEAARHPLAQEAMGCCWLLRQWQCGSRLLLSFTSQLNSDSVLFANMNSVEPIIRFHLDLLIETNIQVDGGSTAGYEAFNSAKMKSTHH